MTLMFSRVAHNYAKKGFYPTDIESLTRILNFIKADKGFYRLIDPSVGEGVALAEVCSHLSSNGSSCKSYGVELEKVRAVHAESCIDNVLHSDFFQTSIEQNQFDFLFFNPPYGDLVSDSTVMHSGEKRLEKKFFRASMGLLRNGGLSVMLLQYTSLDKNFAERIARNFENIQIFRAADPTFKQVIIFGVKRRSHSVKAEVVKSILNAVNDIDLVDMIPANPNITYKLTPHFKDSCIRFRTISVSAELAESELEGNQGLLWNDFDSLFNQRNKKIPQPCMMPSKWHMAMAVVAGCVDGFVENDNGEQYLIKGNVRKVTSKSSETNCFENDNGDVQHEVINRETERYEAEIVGINFTSQSSDFGEVVVIR